MEAGLVVVKGAVLYEHDPDIICSRICQYTYGKDICEPFDVCEPFDKDLHDKIMQTNIEGELLCVGCFLKFSFTNRLVNR